MSEAYKELKRLTDIYPKTATSPEKDDMKRAMRELSTRQDCRRGNLHAYAELVICEPFI